MSRRRSPYRPSLGWNSAVTFVDALTRPDQPAQEFTFVRCYGSPTASAQHGLAAPAPRASHDGQHCVLALWEPTIIPMRQAYPTLMAVTIFFGETPRSPRLRAGAGQSAPDAGPARQCVACRLLDRGETPDLSSGPSAGTARFVRLHPRQEPGRHRPHLFLIQSGARRKPGIQPTVVRRDRDDPLQPIPGPSVLVGAHMSPPEQR